MQKTLFGAVLALAAVATAQAAPVAYTIDSSHTYPSFEAPHMGISLWRGKFNQTSGKVTLDREARSGTVEIQIDAASLDFGHEKMNEHAREADFFNVAEFPQITYRGPIQFRKGEPSAVAGELTLLGVTRPVTLKINSFKCITHPFLKKEVCGADAQAEFNRADFGMSKYADGEGGKVRLAIQVEALRND
jgi:polyisoprenoid-binding protein YceI